MCHVVKVCSLSPLWMCERESMFKRERECHNTGHYAVWYLGGAAFLHRVHVSSSYNVHRCEWCLKSRLCILYRGITARVKSQSLKGWLLHTLHWLVCMSQCLYPQGLNFASLCSLTNHFQVAFFLKCKTTIFRNTFFALWMRICLALGLVNNHVDFLPHLTSYLSISFLSSVKNFHRLKAGRAKSWW